MKILLIFVLKFFDRLVVPAFAVRQWMLQVDFGKEVYRLGKIFNVGLFSLVGEMNFWLLLLDWCVFAISLGGKVNV